MRRFLPPGGPPPLAPSPPPAHPAAGVFGVLAAGFAIMLGFVIFLAFERYDAARSGAEQEALFVVQQFETAQLLPKIGRASCRERVL